MLTLIAAGGVDAVLIADDLPELGPDLVAALAGLDVDDLPHGCLEQRAIRQPSACGGPQLTEPKFHSTGSQPAGRYLGCPGTAGIYAIEPVLMQASNFWGYSFSKVILTWLSDADLYR